MTDNVPEGTSTIDNQPILTSLSLSEINAVTAGFFESHLNFSSIFQGEHGHQKFQTWLKEHRITLQRIEDVGGKQVYYYSDGQGVTFKARSDNGELILNTCTLRDYLYYQGVHERGILNLGQEFESEDCLRQFLASHADTLSVTRESIEYLLRDEADVVSGFRRLDSRPVAEVIEITTLKRKFMIVEDDATCIRYYFTCDHCGAGPKFRVAFISKPNLQE